MDKTQMETEMAAKNLRANELRELRDKNQRELDALDLRVQNGEFAVAGEAAGKSAELDAIGRALAAVRAESLALQSQLDDLEAARLRTIEVERVRGVADALEAAINRRDEILMSAVAALDSAVNTALDSWTEIYDLRREFDAARRNTELFEEAVPLEKRTPKDALFFTDHNRELTAGGEGVKVACGVEGQKRRFAQQADASRVHLRAA